MTDPADRLRWLYLACALLLFLPLWTVPRVPTVDGPCHLYNAWVMHHLDDAAYPSLGRHFELVAEPVPNWLIQALLYALLPLVPAVTAEKLLLSGYVLLFAAAAWYLAGAQQPERRVNAFLALPFVYNLLFHFGFYNFLLSVPLAMLAVGWWWRGRETAGWRWALGLNALLLICYFAHVVALVVAGLAIAVLWAASFERASWRQWARQPWVLLPQLVLPLWFVGTHGSSPVASSWTWFQSWRYLSEHHALFVFHRGHGPARGLTGLFVLLATATLVQAAVRWREIATAGTAGAPGSATRAAARDALLRPLQAFRPLRQHAFLFAAGAAALLYFVAPTGMGGGGILEPRLALFPFLLVLPWLALPRLAGAKAGLPAAALAVLLAGLVAWESVALVRWHRGEARLVDELLAGHAAVPRDSRGLDLIFGRYARLEHQVLGHAVGHVAMAKGLVDWDDYQAGYDLFAVRFRPDVQRPLGVDKPADAFPVEQNAAVVDWLYTWSMPAASPLRARLAPHYRRAAVVGRGELWLRGER